MLEIIEWLYFVIAIIIGFAFYGAIAIGVSSTIIDLGKGCIYKWKN